MTRKTVIFCGHVQGVGFRFTTSRLARKFQVTGTVRNLANGDVELVAEGEPAEVARFIAAVHERMRGNIDDAHSVESSATGEFQSFDIAY